MAVFSSSESSAKSVVLFSPPSYFLSYPSDLWPFILVLTTSWLELGNPNPLLVQHTEGQSMMMNWVSCNATSATTAVTAMDHGKLFQKREETQECGHYWFKKLNLTFSERGSDQTANQLGAGRSVAQFLLRTVSPNDNVGVVTISDVVETVEAEHCRLDKLSAATKSTKSTIERHLRQIHHADDVATVDVLSGFEAARKMLRNSLLEDSANVQVGFSSSNRFQFWPQWPY